MTLSPGTRLGPHEVAAQIGKGASASARGREVTCELPRDPAVADVEGLPC